MSVLVDSSVWVDYFRGTGPAETLDLLIEEGLVVTNDLILAEIIPALHLRKQTRLIALMKVIDRRPIVPDWDDLVRMQIACLRNGINGVGIPDLMIAQNAIQQGLQLLTRDRHFALLSRHVPLTVYPGVG